MNALAPALRPESTTKPIAYDPSPRRISYSIWLGVTLLWSSFFFITALAALQCAAMLLGSPLNLTHLGFAFGLHVGFAIALAFGIGFLNRQLDPNGEKRARRNAEIQAKYAGRVPTFVSLPGSLASACLFFGTTVTVMQIAGLNLDWKMIGLGLVINLPAAFVGAFLTGVVLRSIQARRAR
ncbi:MAG: hypothetical protein SNJ67_05110 [Chloracidobacterium sp.]|uniref:Uncharacterized protein n=1 Tax=Chloracidobacterium validum TaxID=2821543 RepID=A0ABX8B8W0_9BACT|nr:hypothetical protein [Chloracidobacterium validum]QUW02053.1 hypothetical protein J8C06_06675 [Chloracidobacterium validum]